jgi:Ca2+-transporting ATPase
LRGGWLDAVLNGTALGMSMLPEEFPRPLSVPRHGCVADFQRTRADTPRRSDRNSGAATVLCTDDRYPDTNRMTIVELRAGDESWRSQQGKHLSMILPALSDTLSPAREPGSYGKGVHALGEGF